MDKNAQSDSELLKSQISSLCDIKKRRQSFDDLSIHLDGSSTECRNHKDCKSDNCNVIKNKINRKITIIGDESTPESVSPNSSIQHMNYNINQRRSSIEHTRVEERWNKDAEKLFREWQMDLVKNAELHKVAGKKKKKIYNILYLPTVVVPIVLGVVHPPTLILSILLVGSGVLAGVNQSLNLGQTYQEHFHYSYLYGQLAEEIKIELSKSKNHRIQLDLFRERVHNKMDFLNEKAPNVYTPKPSNRNI
jgi:hypothetical protein